MYEKYIKERENLEMLKTDKGFICYRIDFPSCVINDYCVLPEFRQEGHGYFLANQVFELCKQAGVKTVHCFSDDRAIGSALSEFTIYNFGFELLSKDGHVSEYKMEVSEWERF